MGEEYILGYKPQNTEKYDIGINYQVGNKWPLKAWPVKNFKLMEDRITNKYSISWQQGLENMFEYFDWINSCRLIIANDSFGLHLAIALKKKVIAIYGPTSRHEAFFYGLGTALYPHDFSCDEFPCHVTKCIHFENSCTQLIAPEMVLQEIDVLLKPLGKKLGCEG